MKNKNLNNPKSNLAEELDDFDAINREPIDTDKRNGELDADLLKSGEEIAGIELRPISAGDLALLLNVGVGIVIGKMDSLMYDVGAILWSQSAPREEVRRMAADKEAFREKVYAFLDEFDPSLFQDATPRVVGLIERMNKARTSLKGTGAPGEPASPKAGGRAG